jgi:hypothetical protein
MLYPTDEQELWTRMDDLSTQFEVLTTEFHGNIFDTEEIQECIEQVDNDLYRIRKLMSEQVKKSQEPKSVCF